MSTATMREFDALLRDVRHESARAASDLADWLVYLKVDGKADRTLYEYTRKVAPLLREFPDKSLEEFTAADLNLVLGRIPERSRYIARSIYNGFFEWALVDERIERNPMVGRVPKMRQPKRRPKDIFSEEEIALLEALPSPHGHLFAILFDTGIRSSEARAMQVKHVRFEVKPSPPLPRVDDELMRATDALGIDLSHEPLRGERTSQGDATSPRSSTRIAIPHGKGGKGRVIPATDRLARRLAEWFLLDGLNRDDYLWYMRRGGHEINRDRELGPTSIKGWHARSLKAAGVRYRKLHSTRHTFSTRALRRGVSLTAVSRILGHASIKTTDESYSHLVVDDLAAELELLEV